MTHEEVREKAAKELALEDGRNWDVLPDKPTKLFPLASRDNYRWRVDALFGLCYENGQPMIAALAETDWIEHHAAATVSYGDWAVWGRDSLILPGKGNASLLMWFKNNNFRRIVEKPEC